MSCRQPITGFYLNSEEKQWEKEIRAPHGGINVHVPMLDSWKTFVVEKGARLCQQLCL